jgi:hypothetical protein
MAAKLGLQYSILHQQIYVSQKDFNRIVWLLDLDPEEMETSIGSFMVEGGTFNEEINISDDLADIIRQLVDEGDVDVLEFYVEENEDDGN